MLLSVNLFSQRYYKAQMHCHTTNSDGVHSPQQLAEKYWNEGYEILMISDHNYLTLSSEVNVSGMLCIQSEEITFDRHMNGFFLDRVILPSTGFTCQQAIDSVNAQNGLIMLNHYCEGPITNSSWVVSAQEILSFTGGPHMLEIWNTGTETIQTHDDKSIWDAVLTAGKVVWGCATDDYHPTVSDFLEFNKGWNMIWLESLTTENVKSALAEGNFYASTGVTINHYTIQQSGNHKIINIQSDADKIAFWGPNHQKIVEFNSGNATFTLQNHQYIRAELIKNGIFGIGNTYAWTQPVFLNSQANIANNKVNTNIILYVYPNPADELMMIKLTLPSEGEISLQMLDLSGRLIQQISDTYYPQGEHFIQLNTGVLADGTYILQSTYNGHSTAKMIQVLH
jgi:hypothetical protein